MDAGEGAPPVGRLAALEEHVFGPPPWPLPAEHDRLLDPHVYWKHRRAWPPAANRLNPVLLRAMTRREDP